MKKMFLTYLTKLPVLLLMLGFFSCGGDDEEDVTPNEETESGNDKENVYLNCPDNNHPHMIDLGLPSGTKWACCNVGADAPEDFGNYYAWGETEPKAVYNKETYKWIDVFPGPYTKYCNYSYFGPVDGKYILEPSDDAATVNWGAEWHMPSASQIVELVKNAMGDMTYVNGVTCVRFEGSNGGSILMPLAGTYVYDEYNGNYLSWVGQYGNYWSSQLASGDPRYALALYVSKLNIHGITQEGDNREWGLSVRPVH